MRTAGALLAFGLSLFGVDADAIEASLERDAECADSEECSLQLLQRKGKMSEEQSPYACPMVPYHGPAHGPASCFCHKAKNPVCRDKPCTCREGCEDAAVSEQRETVTFVNQKKVHGCATPAAMLTIPRPYYKHIGDLLGQCGDGTEQLLATMFINGAAAYAEQTGNTGPVMQCIHKPGHISVPWLHLHTFCPSGRVDGMPDKQVSMCRVMENDDDAAQVAQHFVQWLVTER